VIALLFTHVLFAQFTISGTIKDQQGGAPLPGASIRLRSTTDSAFSRSLVSDSLGRFSFQQLSADSFLLSISFVGYKEVTRGIRLDTASIRLDTTGAGHVDVSIAMVPTASQDLATVVVTARTPLARQKEDTLEFNASQIKVNPDATAEDLARKVPGITIQNGQVQAHGENVQKVTIDGRELFGDDATAALRNLPAEIIDKIQIFDRLSDQAQFTGFDDGNTTKGINIVTKANMRNGQFGRVYAGYGTDQRYLAGGNATILHENRRISIVGNFNNVNQQNFSQQDLLGVTSNAQRGGGGGGPRGARGGGGNRGQGGGFQGGGNFGGFGNNANFLVGQQNGINRTNAIGINYSDMWGKKLLVTGSYFFNNTYNTTNELANRQYFLANVPNLNQTNIATSNNNNHRINMRLEWRLDSANQIIITPNLSFQNNVTDRTATTSSFYTTGHQVSNTTNATNSNTNGNNLNNTILWRHSFAKRGRTFSINLNTSSNTRQGNVYVNSLQRQFDSLNTAIDSVTNRYTNQANSGYQLSANLVYTEPVTQKSQLMINYNPTYSNSKADQEAFRQNNATEGYTIFDTSLSNRFNNVTKTQNAGLTYRIGSRDNMVSFGANYQYNNISSDQTFPRALQVNKSFNNILPNAMVRLKFSPQSSVRIFYRATTNNPSVTQLSDVYDITNAPFITAGNPSLRQQFTNFLSGRYTYTNTAKSIVFVANLFYQTANDYITNATYVATKDSVINSKITLTPGQQLTVPVNLNGYQSVRSLVTFAFPVAFIKSNLNFNGGVTFSKLPGIINSVTNEANNTTYTAGAVIASNVSQYVDFTVSYTANFSNVTNSAQQQLNDHYFQHIASVQLNLLSKTGWFFQNDLSNQLYNGLAAGYNQNYTLWNMSAGKKFLKNQKGELKLTVFDLLRQNQSITRNVTETYIEDTQNQVLRQYFLLQFTYNLRNFGTAAARQMNGNGGNRNWGGPPRF
jgi:hypothetical protein